MGRFDINIDSLGLLEFVKNEAVDQKGNELKIPAPKVEAAEDYSKIK